MEEIVEREIMEARLTSVRDLLDTHNVIWFFNDRRQDIENSDDPPELKQAFLCQLGDQGVDQYLWFTLYHSDYMEDSVSCKFSYVKSRKGSIRYVLEVQSWDDGQWIPLASYTEGYRVLEQALLSKKNIITLVKRVLALREIVKLDKTIITLERQRKGYLFIFFPFLWICLKAYYDVICTQDYPPVHSDSYWVHEQGEWRRIY